MIPVTHGGLPLCHKHVWCHVVHDGEHGRQSCVVGGCQQSFTN